MGIRHGSLAQEPGGHGQTDEEERARRGGGGRERLGGDRRQEEQHQTHLSSWPQRWLREGLSNSLAFRSSYAQLRAFQKKGRANFHHNKRMNHHRPPPLVSQVVSKQ